jgi:hypothetical protein
MAARPAGLPQCCRNSARRRAAPASDSTASRTTLVRATPAVAQRGGGAGCRVRASKPAVRAAAACAAAHQQHMAPGLHGGLSAAAAHAHAAAAVHLCLLCHRHRPRHRPRPRPRPRRQGSRPRRRPARQAPGGPAAPPPRGPCPCPPPPASPPAAQRHRAGRALLAGCRGTGLTVARQRFGQAFRGPPPPTHQTLSLPDSSLPHALLLPALTCFHVNSPPLSPRRK